MIKKRKIIYTLLGVLLIAICAGGLFFWINKKQATQDLSKSNLPKNYIELDKNYNKAQRIIKYVKPYEPLLTAAALIPSDNKSGIYKGDNKSFEKDVKEYVKSHYQEVKIKGLDDKKKQDFLSYWMLFYLGEYGFSADSNDYMGQYSRKGADIESGLTAKELKSLSEFVTRFVLEVLNDKLKDEIGNSTDYDSIAQVMGYDREKTISEYAKYSKKDNYKSTYLDKKFGSSMVLETLLCTPEFHYYYDETNDSVIMKAYFTLPKSGEVHDYIKDSKTSLFDYVPSMTFYFDSQGNVSLDKKGGMKIKVINSSSSPLNLPKFTPNNLDLDKLPTKEYVTQLSNQLFNIKYEQEDTVFANSYPIGGDVAKQLPHYESSDSDDEESSEDKELDKNSVVSFKDENSGSSTIVTSDNVLPEYDSFTKDTAKYLVMADNVSYTLTFKNKVLTNIEKIPSDVFYGGF
ncbi:hypothetical protein GHI93_03640 [Lactococcus hircilactis]|uniref:Uncharacterized protein n=1 Tax=Lactococcus hircilactis TaxID=1494462 RepID=A0A7X1Z9L4_9LACT|nr:hypothetical protein [Lactococcus hircilactis]MQW39045.1 hypothetical protein [Lactococcus hircilactis]